MLINGDIDEVFAAYKSPIGVLRMRLVQDVAQKIDKMVDESVMQALEEMHIDVDKAELLKALSYDRDQYARGYEDGKAAAQPKWISVEDAMPPVEERVLIFIERRMFDGYVCHSVTCGFYEDGSVLNGESRVSWDHDALGHYDEIRDDYFISESWVEEMIMEHDEWTCYVLPASERVTHWMPLPEPPKEESK